MGLHIAPYGRCPWLSLLLIDGFPTFHHVSVSPLTWRLLKKGRVAHLFKGKLTVRISLKRDQLFNYRSP